MQDTSTTTTEEGREEVDESAPFTVFQSPKLQKIREFIYLLTRKQQEEGWGAGAIYTFYFPKTTIAEVVHGEFGKCEGQQQACKTMLGELQAFVAGTLNGLLEGFTADSDNPTTADDIVGLAKLGVDVHKAVTLEELCLDATFIASSIDQFNQLIAQLSSSSALKQRAIRQKLVPDNTTHKKMTANRSNGVVVFEQGAQELTFDQKLEEHIQRILKKDFRLGAIMNFVGLEPPPHFVVSNEIFKRAVDGLVLAIAQVDIRIKEHVLLLVKLAFYYVKDHQAAMSNFYEREALKHLDEHTPSFRKYYKQFDGEMTQILNAVTDYDSFSLPGALEANNRVVRKLGFLLMIAPQPAIRQILLFCVKSKPLIPSVLWILGRLLPFFALRVLPTQFQSKEKELFIITQFRRFLGGDEGIDMANEQDRSTLEYLLLVMTKTQYKEKGVLAERIISQHPLFEATDLLKDFIIDNLTRSFHVDFTLMLLYKLLQVHGGKDWPINWTQYDLSLETFQGVDPAILISLLVDVHNNEAGNTKIQKSIIGVFRSLGSKLKTDQVKLQHSAFVLYKLNIFDWCVKYFICFSMWDVLVDYRPEIPSVLFNALSGAAKYKFQPIGRPEQCSEVEDFTKSIFELAMVSPDCALELINYFDQPPDNIDQVVVADALLSAVRSHTSSKSIQTLIPVVGGLLDLLAGPTAKQLREIGGDQHAVAKKLEIIGIFFQAVKLYILNNLDGGVNKLSEDKFGEEAAMILQSFCENTLNWLTYDLAPLKDRKFVFTLDKEGSETEERIIQVLLDLQKLVCNIKFLDRRLCSLPISVKNVNNEILVLFDHLYRQFFGSSFDALNQQDKNNELENLQPDNGSSARQILSNVQNLVVATHARRGPSNRRQSNQRRLSGAPSNSGWRQGPQREGNQDIPRGYTTNKDSQVEADRTETTNGDLRRPYKGNKHKNKKRYSNRPEGDSGSQQQQQHFQPPQALVPN